jgi:hypothetical protein
VIAPSCAEDPRVCAIFDTWAAEQEPCQVPTCTACTLQHATCGTFQPASNSTTCRWRYVECAHGRVSKVVLGGLQGPRGACVQQNTPMNGPDR